MLKKYGINF